MSAIVAKALNSTIGTADFKGFDQVIKAVLEENNTNIERILTDFTTKMNAKGLVASEDLYYYVWNGNFRNNIGSDSNITANLGESVTFKCNGSVKINLSAVEARGDFKVYLNDTQVLRQIQTDAGKIEASEHLAIHIGDVLRCEVTGEYDVGTSKYYAYANKGVFSITAKEANLSGIGL